MQDIIIYLDFIYYYQQVDKLFTININIKKKRKEKSAKNSTPGFYYDMYMGAQKLVGGDAGDMPKLEKKIGEIVKQNDVFERCILSKEEALELFSQNPFKVQLITNKIPDGGFTSCYRVGDLIDLCRGPHLPSSGRAKAFWLHKNSSSYWLGQAENDSLQRIYGISFPVEKELKQHKFAVEEAKKRDHRVIGNKQDLFFFDPEYSAGSTFWQPAGAKLYQKLMEFMKREYIIRGFQEVITPNIYNSALFKASGHYYKYKDNMYNINIEGEDWYLKPMNCPGHCVAFAHKSRSYKELPIRMADFGVLHRNELSGTLTGECRKYSYRRTRNATMSRD
jgi:threonyl-tRNA synthetase